MHRAAEARANAMGNEQGTGGFPGQGRGDQDKDKKEEKKKFEGAPPPSRVGKKRKSKGPDGIAKLPVVTPAAKCQLRLLKLNRVLDFLKMEQEFVANQEAMKPVLCVDTTASTPSTLR